MHPFAHAAARRGPIRSAAFLGLALLAGCADRHSIEVGSIPDDYRTRHPIVVDEDETLLELPVTSAETRLPQDDVERVEDFARRFRASRATTVRILVPEGTRNAGAARLAAHDAVAALRREGVPRSRILVQPYGADAGGGAVPIRLGYTTLAARTAPCGRWPEDLGDTEQNRNYHNFGCASQQNLAAQIADPRDLLAPRGVGEIDAARRTDMLEKYRVGRDTASERSATESDYNW